MLNETILLGVTNACDSVGTVLRLTAVTLVLVFLAAHARCENPVAKRDIVKNLMEKIFAESRQEGN